MKRLFQIVLMCILLNFSTFVYAEQILSDCGPIPEKPMIPSGLTAEKWIMELAIENVKEYNVKVKKYIDCNKREINELIRNYNEINKDLSEAIEEFKRQKGTNK